MGIFNFWVRKTRHKDVGSLAGDIKAIIPVLLTKMSDKFYKTESYYNVIFKTAILEVSLLGHSNNIFLSLNFVT